MQINSVGSINSAMVSSDMNQGRGLQSQTSTTQTAAPVPTQTEASVQALGGIERSKPPTVTETKEAVEKLNDLVKATNQSLQFSVDEDTNIKLVKLIDLNTKETIRQFPSEEVINIAKAIDKFQGMLVRDKA